MSSVGNFSWFLSFLFCTFFASKSIAAPGQIVIEEESEQAKFRLVSVAEELDFAWDIAFLPNGDLLLSEYDGRLRLLTSGTQQHIIDAVKETTPSGGLRGIAPHPEFEENSLLYFCFAYGAADNNHTRIGRARLVRHQVIDFETIFVADNASHDLAHYGCRLLWLKDGTLLATLGDRRHYFDEAQNLSNHYGTVVRINDDGSIPDDNPFVASADMRHEIWAYGLRNVQGASIHPETGLLWITEHGPLGGDEINILQAGRNYGWPIATFGIDYDGSVLTETPRLPHVEPPIFYWYPSIAPSSVAFYTGDDFPKWHGDLFVTTLRHKRLVRLEIQDDRVIHQEDLLAELDTRIRDISMGPDGSLYVLTDTGDNRLFRIEASPIAD